MRRKVRAPTIIPPEHQPDATINVTNPVSGQKYEWEYPPGTPLGTQKNVRILSIMVKCTWTVQPSPLQVHFTLDGLPYVVSQIDPGTDTFYQVQDRIYVDTYILVTPPKDRPVGFLNEGRSVKVEAEITGGTVSNLSARVKWAKW